MPYTCAHAPISPSHVLPSGAALLARHTLDIVRSRVPKALARSVRACGADRAFHTLEVLCAVAVGARAAHVLIRPTASTAGHALCGVLCVFSCELVLVVLQVTSFWSLKAYRFMNVCVCIHTNKHTKIKHTKISCWRCNNRHMSSCPTLEKVHTWVPSPVHKDVMYSPSAHCSLHARQSTSLYPLPSHTPDR